MCAFSPVPDVAPLAPFAEGSGTVCAILARSLAGIPSGAVSGTEKPPGGKKASRWDCWNISSF